MTDNDIIDMFAYKLAELGGNNAYRALSDPNRFLGLDVETKFMYRRRSQDILDAIHDRGWRVVEGVQ